MKKTIRVVKTFKIVKRSCSFNRYYRVVRNSVSAIFPQSQKSHDERTWCILLCCKSCKNGYSEKQHYLQKIRPIWEIHLVFSTIKQASLVIRDLRVCNIYIIILNYRKALGDGTPEKKLHIQIGEVINQTTSRAEKIVYILGDTPRMAEYGKIVRATPSRTSGRCV